MASFFTPHFLVPFRFTVDDDPFGELDFHIGSIELDGNGEGCLLLGQVNHVVVGLDIIIDAAVYQTFARALVNQHQPVFASFLVEVSGMVVHAEQTEVVGAVAVAFLIVNQSRVAGTLLLHINISVERAG